MSVLRRVLALLIYQGSLQGRDRTAAPVLKHGGEPHFWAQIPLPWTFGQLRRPGGLDHEGRFLEVQVEGGAAESWRFSELLPNFSCDLHENPEHEVWCAMQLGAGGGGWGGEVSGNGWRW